MAEKRRELAELAALPDGRIDFSDIPEIKELPPDTVVGKFYRPKKCEGYQTRINAYLRQLMRRQRSR